MNCAQCGKKIFQSASSLPPGEATCQPCRRQATWKRRAEKQAKTYKQVECPICHVVFEQTQHSQVYCSAACRESRRNWSYAKAATPDERGYGKAHRDERARWKLIVDAYQASCCLCGYPIAPGEKWHLDHTEDRTGYRGVAHASCNVRDGARRGARSVNAQRRTYDKQCPTCTTWFTTVYPKQAYCSRECRPKATSKRRPKPPAMRPVHFKQCERCQLLFTARTLAKRFCSERCQRGRVAPEIRTHFSCGHAITRENTYHARAKHWRQCRICRRIKKRADRKRARARQYHPGVPLTRVEEAC